MSIDSNSRVVYLGEIPAELMNQPRTYSVTLVGLEHGSDRDFPYHCGSGTLVKYRGQHYILTANHCAEPLYGYDKIGLPIRNGGRPLIIEKIPPIYVGKRITDEWGPDLAFIPIHPVDANNINNSSSKTFYNLDRQEAEMISGNPETEEHLWAVVGTPISESNLTGPIVYEFKQYTYTAAIETTSIDNGIDYLEVRASLNGTQADDTFLKGLSGGGLWYAQLDIAEDGTFVLNEKLQLEGVAFYRTAQEGDYVHVRCHGRRSIYEIGLAELRAELARRAG